MKTFMGRLNTSGAHTAESEECLETVRNGHEVAEETATAPTTKNR